MSETAAKPRPSALKIVGAVVGLIVLMVLSGWGIASCQAAATVKHLRGEIPGLIARIRARPGTRPVLRGEAAPGPAWECYNQALKCIEPLKGRSNDYKALSALADGKPDADPETCRKLVQEFSIALEHLAAGAARGDGSNRIEWERGINAPTPGLLASQNLANLAASKARLLAAGGRHREALDAVSDIFMLGRDLAHNSILISYMIGIAIKGIALSTLRNLVTLPDFPAAELPEVARRLEVMDSNWPDLHDVLLNEVTAARITCTDPNSAEAIDLGPLTGIMLANGIPRCDSYYRRMAESCGKPWGEIAPIDAVLKAEVESAWNPLVRMTSLSLESMVRADRQRRAQLRLLRACVGWRITGQVSNLQDPFGGEILSAPPKFWSRNKNGMDDGGRGEWTPNGADLVLEAAR